MLLVADTSRKFPIQQVKYLDYSVDDLFEFLLAVKRANCPNWTDESPSDVGVQLLWMFTVLSDFMVRHIERMKDNSFIGTTQDRESMRRLCELLGYELSEMSASSVTVTVTHTTPHSAFNIPKGTKFSTASESGEDPIIFESSAQVNVPTDAPSSNIPCVQGETVSNKIIGSSDGSASQAFDVKANNVIWHSEVVEVHDGVSWSAWTRVSNFVDSTSTDEHYMVEIRGDNQYYIVFGNGVNGVAPPSGINNVRVTYRKGVGELGNVPAGTITNMIDTIANSTAVTNSSDASGGNDRETLDHARIYAPATIKVSDRVVTKEDAELMATSYISDTYGGIAAAKAVSVGPQQISMMVVPAAGGYPSSGLRSELQLYIAERTIMGMSLQVIDPVFITVDITATVSIYDNYNPTDVNNEVRARLVRYLTPTYRDPESGAFTHGFGRDIRISDIYRIIDSTPGVDFANLTVPSVDVIIDEEQIADVGTITINISQSGQNYSFQNTKNDVIKFLRDAYETDQETGLF